VKKLGKILTTLLLVLVMVAGLIVPGTAATTPKNVIVIIADGCGFNQYLAANYYLYGKAGASTQEQFPVKLAMSTYSHGQANVTTDDIESVYNPDWWNDPTRFMFGATDSAAAASAMSTGVKTWDKAIGMTQDGTPSTHMIEDFEALGKSTGVVTNVPLNHATPAGFIAHNNDRNKYDDIAKEIYNSALEVSMGCGHPLYNDNNTLNPEDKPNEGHLTVATWTGIKDGTLPYSDANGDGTADAWTYIQEKADFEALTTGDTPDRVIGIAKSFQTTQEYRGDPFNTKDAFVEPFNTDVPNLPTMAKGALNVLDNNKNGFFLMVEAGAVDWCGHFGQSGRLIEEMTEFFDTVDTVCAWVEANSSWNETLLVVTGDHETGYLTGMGGSYNAVSNNGKGVMPTMTWNTNTMDKKYAGYLWHSNQLIPFFAKGVGSDKFNEVADLKDPVRGAYLDNTELSVVIRQLMGVAPSSWAIKNVYLAVDRGLVPKSLQKNWQTNITRNDFCTLAFELAKKVGGAALQAPTEEKPMPFTDTTSDVVYTLNQLGIINGKGSATTFAPNDLITRQEAAVLINNLATYLKCAMLKEIGSPNYADGWAIGSWAKTAVDNAYMYGAMKSTGGNNFSPLANYSVEQAICSILQLYKIKNTGDMYVWDVAR
jgi:alkaline phosphatase